MTRRPPSSTVPAVPSQMSHIYIPPSATAESSELVQHLVDLINHAWVKDDEPPSNIHKPGFQRAENETIKRMLYDCQLGVALRPGISPGPNTVPRPEEVLGTVALIPLTISSWEIGMIVCDSKIQSNGIGRRLLRFGENSAHKAGMTKAVVTLLIARDWVHPGKQRLNEWYERAGYCCVRVEEIGSQYEWLLPMLSCPCQLKVFEKAL